MLASNLLDDTNIAKLNYLDPPLAPRYHEVRRVISHTRATATRYARMASCDDKLAHSHSSKGQRERRPRGTPGELWTEWFVFPMKDLGRR